jgi:hypothetical protein
MMFTRVVAAFLDMWYVRDPLDPRNFAACCVAAAATDPLAWLTARGFDVEVCVDEEATARERGSTVYRVRDRSTGFALSMCVSQSPEAWCDPYHEFVTLPESAEACAFGRTVAAAMAEGTR